MGQEQTEFPADIIGYRIVNDCGPGICHCVIAAMTPKGAP